jgi:hypothetical protein
MSKTPVKGSPTPAKSPSPRRRNVKQATLKEKLKKSSGSTYTLTMYAMDPSINAEIVLYTKGKDGAFLVNYKNYTEGKLTSNEFVAANFTGCFVRRQLGPENIIMLDSNGKYWRKLIIRHPIDRISTP